MPEPLGPVRAVDHGSLVQLCVHIGQRSQEDDGAPAGFLPDILPYDHPPENARIAQIVNGPSQQLGGQLVDDAVCSEDHVGDGNHDHDGNEMRHIQQGLGHLLVMNVADFIEHQGKDNRRREGKDDAHEGKDQRIGQIGHPFAGGEEALEPV